METNQGMEKLTSIEVGKLWITYIGNSMSKCVLDFFLQHVDDEEIKKVVESARNLSEQFVQTVKDTFIQENFPVPVGFTKEDVNLDAPRLFLDEFYLHYLKYVGKAGISIYSAAIPLMTRVDVREFFTNSLDLTVKLINQVNDILIEKGMLIKPPYIPIPENVDFVKKQNYLSGFFGDVRPLQALEIAHLYDNIQNNATSKAVLIGFSQAAKQKQLKEFFLRGKEIASKHIDIFSELLHKDDLPSFPTLDHLVTNSTSSPFSDKLLLSHKIDMFSMRIRAYGNGLSFNVRHDVGAVYARFLAEVGHYAQDAANILIDNGWLEQPPQAADRDALVLK